MTNAEIAQMQSALARAIEHGQGLSALARRIGVSRQAINNWRERGVPAERAVDIERALDGHVSRRELRPDIFSNCGR